MNSKKAFIHWFIVPLQWLKAVPNNDGSFIALASALFLYERYIVAKLKSIGEKATETRKFQQVASDFGVSTRVARIFWDVMRNGILHQGMPKLYEQGKKHLDWIFHHNKSDFAFELQEFNGKPLLIVQPWLVVDKIILLWQEDLDLLEQNESFPWAHVSSVTGSSSQSSFFLVTGSSSGLSILGIDDESFD
jgi:hypothetical protein